MTGGLTAGALAAGATGLSGFPCAAGAAAALAGFSAPGGLASSSAMMRRIDARISSMEGSWTFAGCVISDSKSSTLSHVQLYTKRGWICRFRLSEARDFRRASLTCPQIKRRGNRHAVPSLLQDIETSRRSYERPPRIALLPHRGYVIGINDCKQRAGGTDVIRASDSRGVCTAVLLTHRPARRPTPGPSMFDIKRRQRPSGVRTPNQLSRTC